MDENQKHDYKTPIEKTSVENARIILQNFMENFDVFVYPDRELTPEETAAIDEKATDFSISVLSLISATDIPADYASYALDKIMAGMSGIKRYIDGSIRQMNDEILSRTLEAKNPETNTYAKDCATLGQMMLKLKEVRDSQGNKPEDYFIPKKQK